MSEIMVLGGVVGFVLFLILPGGGRRLFGLIVAVLSSLRWLAVIGLVTSLLNSPQFYRAFGWTPVSVLVGKSIYEEPKKKEIKKIKHEKITSRP